MAITKVKLDRLPDEPEWFTVKLDKPFTMHAGTRYWVVLSTEDDGVVQVKSVLGLNSGYKGQGAYFAENGDSSGWKAKGLWEAQKARDMVFKAYATVRGTQSTDELVGAKNKGKKK